MIDLLTKKSVENFSVGSFLAILSPDYSFADQIDDNEDAYSYDEPMSKGNATADLINSSNKNEMIINLNVSAVDKKGIYTLEIIPHFDDHRASTKYNLIVKLDYKNELELKMSGSLTNGK